ncbi:type II toxin-antitoxin system Phd/YefM family antitoxin [Aquihabitans sp. McL0605]|uniref:type II toxin-antitoxin system Phd/YefM family antitoxin n=1 Tax=Aquihabitans sp. McL0605 TaxID=3415671 RepID=UPI003CF194E4
MVSVNRQKSDNLILMPEISATDASRRFADLLDGVEHRGESYTIVRRGRVVARLEPVAAATGADLKVLLGRHQIDDAWAGEVAALREQLVPEERF